MLKDNPYAPNDDKPALEILEPGIGKGGFL